jgi:hypothetical protein
MCFCNYEFQNGMPFDFLDGVEFTQRSDTSFDFSIHDLASRSFGWYANNVFNYRRKGGLVDVGDRIVRSFNDRDEFSLGEQTVARDFFWKDYSHSFGCAQDCLKRFETGQEAKVKNPAYLASVLIRRTGESLNNAMFFSELYGFEEEASFDPFECLSDLANYRTRVHLAVEFPDNYHWLTDLIYRRDEAVGLENYVLAAEIRDEIDGFTRFSHPNFPKTL